MHPSIRRYPYVATISTYCKLGTPHYITYSPAHIAQDPYPSVTLEKKKTKDRPSKDRPGHKRNRMNARRCPEHKYYMSVLRQNPLDPAACQYFKETLGYPKRVYLKGQGSQVTILQAEDYDAIRAFHFQALSTSTPMTDVASAGAGVLPSICSNVAEDLEQANFDMWEALFAEAVDNDSLPLPMDPHTLV
ncbi:uncharacterized protein RSE6_05526 [Rhynchosporium secalis]|uniref:Uncharacterized protein n=1 Tax=Rhynchosporium secalis TaxID=38038 RepID=A0A1E1M803_RHYSE|nr:uncharacterized protein RSE6_05526 [Rhynchosporium secalis]